MSDPTSYSGPAPTLQPAGTHPYAAPPPQGRQPMPQTGRRKRGGGWKIVFLVLALLVLVASLVTNYVLLAGFDGGFSAAGDRMSTRVLESGSGSEVVALYAVQGVIDGKAAANFRAFRNSVVNDGDVKAVVLRVDSPGGGVTSSDQICQMVRQLKAAGKRVVVSMGSVAASGGYYISAPADEIVAETTTVTGSIGVIAGWIVLKGTLDKLGAEPVIIKSTHAEGWKDEASMLRLPHDYQIEHYRGLLDKMQARFEEVVRAGRGNRLKPRQVTYTIPARTEAGRPEKHTETAPLNGKIYLADEARDFGLIDAIGYQSDAIDRAAALAGLSDRRVVQYRPKRSFMEQFMQARSGPELKLDASLLDRLQTPRFMMLWKAE